MLNPLNAYVFYLLVQLNTIWVSCHGEAPADREHIGEIKIYPLPGFPGYFYPYTNTEGYLSPLVAVHFRRPAGIYNSQKSTYFKVTVQVHVEADFNIHLINMSTNSN